MARRLGDQAARLNKAVRTFERATAGPGPIRLTINDDDRAGTTGFDRLFVGLGATVDAFPSALQHAVPTIRAAHREVFRTEGKSGRGAWRPLAESTVAERRRLGYGGRGPILKRTGALERHVLSAPARVTSTAGGYELRIKPGNSVRGVPKYRPLAKGARRLPARPMVALGPGASVKVTSAISRYLRQRAAANGLG